jgi:hypothetical protein
MAHTSLFDFTRPHRSVNLLTTSGEWDGKIRATTVGTNGMPSYYETYDQNGGVAEFTEKSVLLRDKDLNGTPYNFSLAKQAWGGNYLLSVDGFTASGNQDAFSTVPVASGKPGFGFRVGSINSSIELSGTVSGTSITFSTGTYDPIHMDTRVEVSGSGMLNFTTITNVVLKSNNEVKVTLDRDSGVNGDRNIKLSLSNPLNQANMVTVGNSGNAVDTNGRGRVNYNYNIGKFSVTYGEWANFLNSAASGSDKDILWHSGMTPVAKYHSIVANYGDYGFRVKKAYENKPLENLSWEAAAMYCNFLHNTSKNDSRPAPLKLRDGAYDLKTNVKSFNRSAGARYFLPTVEEWYKAAYYHPGGADAYGRGYIPSGAGYSDFAIMNDNKPSVQEDINKYGDGPQILDCGLFDRNSFENAITWSGKNGAEKILWALHGAADRWDNVITLIRDYRHKDASTAGQYKNSARYMQIKEKYEHYYEQLLSRGGQRKYKVEDMAVWCGLKLEYISFYNSSHANIASAGPRLITITNDAKAGEPCRQRFLPSTFTLQINTRFLNTYSENDWLEILTNQLGRALGFGTLWPRNFGPNLRNPWNSCTSAGGTGSGGAYNSTDLDGDFFINTSKAYNAAVNDGVERRLIPITGLSQFNHTFLNTYRDDTASTDGLEYPGLSNDVMATPHTTHVSNSIISTVTIGNMIDLGYYGHVNHLTGEPTLTLANKS